MIHGDAHHLGITAIPGNRGNGQFDGHWLALVMKHVGMRKIGGLTQTDMLLQCEQQNYSSGGWLALYMVEERDVRGHSMGQSLFMRALHVLFQSPLPRLRPTMRQGTGSSRCISQSSNHVNHFTYTSATRGSLSNPHCTHPSCEVDTHPKLGEREDEPLERISTRPLCPR
ncbi:uncharacterized protein TNCV_2431131 [Trichonephila clavipes]|nr:uncharacterized protein TNCV_2431131 [Trichonephila clavipes]